MNKSYTLFHLTILKTKKSKKKSSVNKKSLKKIYQKYSRAMCIFKLKPSDKVVNNILKYADL